MWFLYDNAVAALVAAVCSLLAWLYGGTIASALLPAVPWLLAVLLEMMLCFPQRHSGETTYEARARVWADMKRDPILWFALLLLALMLIPFFNKGLCPCCDYPAIHFDGASEAPPLPFLPYCVDRLEHFNVLLWFLCAVLAMLATRHALLKRGKRLALRLVVWNGVALSAVGMIQHVTGAESPLWATGWDRTAYFFSTFGYPNMGGDYFTTLFCLAVAQWRWDVDSARRRAESDDPEGGALKTSHVRFWSKHLMLVPAAIFFFSAMMTLSRAAILLVAALAVIFFAHALTCFLWRMDRARRVKTIAVNLIVLVLMATFFLVFLSGRDKMLEKEDLRAGFRDEVSTIDGRGILDRISGHGQYHTRVSLQVWKDHILFGCGGWGYKHLCIPKMTDEEFANLQKVGGINVHNDYLQFLAEHGLVGFSLLAAMAVALIWPVGRAWKNLVKAARFMKPKLQPPKPTAIFAFPAAAFAVLAGALATFIHGFADCPLRSPAVLTLFFVSLAAIDGFLPKMRER